MGDIGRTQNLEVNLRRQLAARRVYLRGKWIYFGGTSFAVLLALVSPVVLLFLPSWGPALGAIAGVWIFVSRLLFEPWRQRLQLEGATAQEMFDCSVLGLEWNSALARRLSEEQVRRESGTLVQRDRVENWYPADVVMDWPKSVLTCQRTNMVWARRQHKSFGVFLISCAIVWAVIGVLVAVWDGASLGAYLVTIGLPSLPALLDALDMIRGHWRAAEVRQSLEDTIDSYLSSRSATTTDLRDNQDQLFALRRQAPLVPEWYYKLVKPGFETDMRYAARLVVDDGEGDAGNPENGQP